MANTIDITQLKADFGTFLGNNENDILKALTQPTESMAFMTTVKQNEDFLRRHGLTGKIRLDRARQ